MAVTYAAHVCNQMPKLNGVCPEDLFSGSTVPRHRLLDLHVWGCPVYVLDPKLQQGQKLPRWKPRSRQGIFIGLITQHASEALLVLNCKTGSITTQFHVVFDDLFSTVPSVERENTPPVIGRNFVWTAPLTFSSKIHRLTFNMTGSLIKNAKTSTVKTRGRSRFALLNCDVINLILQAPPVIIPNEQVTDAPEAFYDAFQDDPSNDTVPASNVPPLLPPPVPTCPVTKRRSTRINSS
jgi:hypothetical protein